MKKMTFLGLAVLLGGCTAANPDRLAFCNEAGQEIDGVFLDLQSGVMVLNDVLLQETLDCDRSNLCFDPAERVFHYGSAEGLNVQREIEAPIAWGNHSWAINPANKRIRFKAADWIAESCKPVNMRFVHDERD